MKQKDKLSSFSSRSLHFKGNLLIMNFFLRSRAPALGGIIRLNWFISHVLRNKRARSNINAFDMAN